VTCWYLAADGTIDEKIIHLLERKRIIVDKATDGKPGELRFSIFNELVEIILPQEEQENEG
jgi:SNF2 family DNA or RNA helicase